MCLAIYFLKIKCDINLLCKLCHDIKYHYVVLMKKVSCTYCLAASIKAFFLSWKDMCLSAESLPNVFSVATLMFRELLCLQQKYILNFHSVLGFTKNQFHCQRIFQTSSWCFSWVFCPGISAVYITLPSRILLIVVSIHFVFSEKLTEN